MKYRVFGRTGWQVSEVGYGMWAVGGDGGGWFGSDDSESMKSLHRSVELGCNFFDTALAYGRGHSEKLLGDLVKAYPNQRLYVASKVPPKNLRWPAEPSYPLSECYPYDYIIKCTERSLKNLDTEQLDLMQLHTWDDSWAEQEEWQRAAQDLKQQGKIGAFGISVDRWEPANVVAALRTGLVDAVQVIYNIFDQNPEDELFPVCRELNVGVIARVPFDEGSLTGTLTKDSKWDDGDWRNKYFGPENLGPTLERVEALRPIVPAGMSLAELALRFIFANPDVHTAIPGMRKLRNVEQNIGTSDGVPLSESLMAELRKHRWERVPEVWAD